MLWLASLPWFSVRVSLAYFAVNAADGFDCMVFPVRFDEDVRLTFGAIALGLASSVGLL